MATFVVIGIGYACLVTGWAGLVRVLSPSSYAAQVPFGLGYLALLYLVAALLGAVCLALVWPITRWRLGAIVAGAVAVLPLYLGAAAVVVPRDEWIPVGLGIGIVLSTVVGGILGYSEWQANERAV